MTKFSSIFFRPAWALLVICLFIFTSCMETKSPSSSRRKKTSSSVSTNDNGTSTSPAPTFSTNLYWFDSKKIDGDYITINQNTQSVIYLRGSDIHNFLSQTGNFQKSYCAVFSYSDLTAKKQVRSKVVPISFYDFSTGVQEKLLRIDLIDEAANSSLCSGSVDGYSTTANIAFAPKNFCPTCTTIIASNKIALYQSSLGIGTQVSTALVNLTGKGMRIDTISGATSGESSCTTSDCQLKGFDCCLNGQCVTDASLKPNATSSTEYAQAQADVALDPLNFKKWPNIYYVCSLNSPIDTTPSPGPDPNVGASEAFEKLKREYYCLEEGKKEFPDYSTGVCSKSTYTTKNSCTTNGVCSNITYTNIVDCQNAGKIWTYHTWTNYCGPTGDLASYTAIRSDVWARCGCEADPFPTDPTDPQCPDFGLRAKKDAAGNITEVLCDVPEPIGDPKPFQNLKVNLPARSAPHRFYLEQTGQSIDLLDNFNFEAIIPGETPVQEGVEFSYIDESSKLEPNNAGGFNINAIIGQMDVSLSKARPALMIDVSVDQVLILSTIEGFYNPCPQCAKDSWFDSFMAFPPSQKGRGLEAIGHSTNRLNYSTNTTLGNYEDTIFGRACWLPPTMIPYSHKKGLNVIDQRRDRLKTQAALFSNGYQRDWFGFNKGAVIASFDGAKWFAVGNGRRVTATSNKLFLAMNGVFADLADPTTMVVSITTEQGDNVASDHEFDPELSAIDARQNSAASCQKYHQCTSDSDCVAQLGWEYMCANTAAFRSYIPNFDADGNEKLDAIEARGFFKVLEGGIPAGTTKRCVYRGAGAPCKKDYNADHVYTTDSTFDRKKMFMCAPNFYCADLNSSVFNDEIIREPNNIFGILLGQEANVLGRPKNYIRGTKSITTVVKNNLVENAKLYHTGASSGTWGLCRPGKNLGSSSHLTQHQSGDSSLRTDYISQIGSCDPDTTGNNRTRACPAFDDTMYDSTMKLNKNYGNYDFVATDATKRSQNFCGKASKDSSGSSVFRDIELPSSPNKVDLPSVVESACLRKAGSFCHTDLDCSPNSLHAETAELYANTYFGGTDAEQLFWKESLVCGQAQPQPYISSALFANYKLNANRCCREVGKSFTMFTSSTNGTLTSLSDNNSSSLETWTRSSTNPATLNRYSRYDIFSSLQHDTGTSATRSTTLEYQAPWVNFNQIPPPAFQWRSIHESGRRTCCGKSFIRKFSDGTNDWARRDRLKIDPKHFACLNYRNELPLIKIYGDTGPFGNIFGRLFTAGPGFNATGLRRNYNNDIDNYCLAPHSGKEGSGYGKGGGCINVPFASSDDTNLYKVVPPDDINTDSNVTVSFLPVTNPLLDGDPPQFQANHFPEAPFPPSTWDFPDVSNIDDIRFGKGFSFWAFDSAIHLGAGFFWPSYITNTVNNFSARMNFYCQPGSDGNCQDGSGASVFKVNEGTGKITEGPNSTLPDTLTGIMAACTAAPVNPFVPALTGLPAIAGTDESTWCIAEPAGYNKGHAAIFALNPFDNSDPTNAGYFPWVYAGMEFTFRPPNTFNFTYNMNPLNDAAGAYTDNTGLYEFLVPGNSLYYLTKLGRLELLGIPQIFYEPIYCNTNKHFAIPEMFQYNRRPDIETNFATYNSNINQTSTGSSKNMIKIYNETSTGTDDSNSAAKATYIDGLSEKLKDNPIWSEHEFKCCAKLGSTVSDYGTCCSGFGLPDPANNAQFICKLPRGSDLNVFYNRFVSSEGMIDDLPDDPNVEKVGFKETDFIPETGEIKLNDTTYNTLVALGQKHCSTGTVRQGGAFGNYYGQPNRALFQDPDDPDKQITDADKRIFGIVDDPQDWDSSQTYPAGYNAFTAGFRWNHHYYCD